MDCNAVVTPLEARIEYTAIHSDCLKPYLGGDCYR